MLIDKVFYEFESDSYNFEDYLIVPKNYKFTKLACKLNIINIFKIYSCNNIFI